MSVVLVGALTGAFCAGGALGACAAWWAHRRTRLSAWNLYPLAPIGLVLWLAALAARRIELLPLAGCLASGGVAAAALARR